MTRRWTQWAVWAALTAMLGSSMVSEAGPTAPKVVAISLLLVLFALITAGLLAVMPQPERRAPRSVPLARCYLVVHLDLKQSPPTAIFVHTYSCSAKDLTMTGLHEARADLYMVEADTFEEALDHMQHVQPLYFPWVTPLLTRKQ